MPAPILELQNLHKSFGDLPVLRDITFSIPKGDIFGIIGKSGVGKSTLVRCINFLEVPTSGEIIFDGQPLSRLSKRDLYHARQSMGMIFQQFNLMMQRTALGNICFPLELAGWDKKSARKRALELLDLVGLPDKADAYPAQLSGGQRQRVAIARAITLNPKVLLCDEATSALDPETTRGILELLKEINREFQITIVAITHEMPVIETLCRQVIILDNAQVAESGTVQEVFTNPKSPAARKLVYPEGEYSGHLSGERCCRIVFDGHSSFEPVIADVVLRFKQPVNILHADTKNISGKAFGQMVIQLPEDDAAAENIKTYIANRGLSVEEVEGFV